MKTLLIILLAFTITYVVTLLLKKSQRTPSGENKWPFYVKRPMGAAEQVLYFRLIQALPQHIILAQVSASRILNVKPSYNFLEWNKRIEHLSYDFVVCDQHFRVIAAIELDDTSPTHLYKQDADAKKTKICKDAGLRLIRWHVKLLPDEFAIQAAFSEPVITNNLPPKHVHDQEVDQLLSSGG